MAWRNKEAGQSNVNSFPKEETGFAKCKSYLNHHERMKESMCLVSAFENLKLDSERSRDTYRSSSSQTKDANNTNFKYNYEAKFQNSNYQGTLYSSDNMAPNCKKDSRMSRWKSVPPLKRDN